jgi:hypothetical protein
MHSVFRTFIVFLRPSLANQEMSNTSFSIPDFCCFCGETYARLSRLDQRLSKRQPLPLVVDFRHCTSSSFHASTCVGENRKGCIRN